jgi:hypothetical protein
VPIVYRISEEPSEIIVRNVDGSTTEVAGTALDAETSDTLFRRLGTVAVIEVNVTGSSLSSL